MKMNRTNASRKTPTSAAGIFRLGRWILCGLLVGGMARPNVSNAETVASYPKAGQVRIDYRKPVYFLRFKQDRFRTICADSNAISQHLSSPEIEVIQGDTCMIHNSRSVSSDSTGFQPALAGDSLLWLRNAAAPESFRVFLGDISSVSQKDPSAGLEKGEGGVIKKSFQMTSGIVFSLVAIGALGIILFILFPPRHQYSIE